MACRGGSKGPWGPSGPPGARPSRVGGGDRSPAGRPYERPWSRLHSSCRSRCSNSGHISRPPPGSRRPPRLCCSSMPPPRCAQVEGRRQMALAMRWLITAARARTGRPMREGLAQELIDASHGQGTAVRRREELHRMAEANRAFAHYRW